MASRDLELEAATLAEQWIMAQQNLRPVLMAECAEDPGMAARVALTIQDVHGPEAAAQFVTELDNAVRYRQGLAMEVHTNLNIERFIKKVG